MDFDLLLGGVPRFAAESPWARRIVRRYARDPAPSSRVEVWDRQPTVADLPGDSPHVLVVADPEAYLTPVAARSLLATLERELVGVAIPVTNEPWCEEARFAPPFPYHTPTLLEEAASWTAQQAPPARRIAHPRSPVFSARREVLRALPPELPLEDVPQEAARRGADVVLDSAAYLHRYGEMDGQARTDLVARIPQGSRSVLDVGCSRAATARALRQAGVQRVVGIEPDAEDAAEAARSCDRVITRPLEEVTEDFAGEFDAILFGDVLEHLVDPSTALVRVRPWLSPRGAVIASVPNLGHWSVLADLVEGRFDYIPYSILSGTHIRFFTRRSLSDLFEASGYRVEAIETVTFPPSPAGRARLESLSSCPGASGDLTAVEFLAVARADA
jgi:2-polyprenyl-3-methyl-5-hydroxy-6-metoxy-1,4-benzoquinol methylase